MPTYDYKCPKCGNVIEVFHKISDTPHKTCPKCKTKLQRMISGGAGLIFKGSGFYATDYKRKTGSGKRQGAKPKSDCAKCPADCPAKTNSGDKQ